ncbi:MAG: hypothetical protein WAO71_10780 [Gallionella sp.]
MSWRIVSKIKTVQYKLGGEYYQTDEIKFLSEEFHDEPGEYKEPNDTVCVAAFEADSEHGKFTWKVSARRSGFETYAAIEDVFEATTPNPSIEVDKQPSFDIENEDE